MCRTTMMKYDEGIGLFGYFSLLKRIIDMPKCQATLLQGITNLGLEASKM
jgi:hypothetical protein